MATFLSDITDQTSDTLRQAGAYVDDLTTPTLRLGVTGLSRAGKTVFITALVHALTKKRSIPPLSSIERLPDYCAFLEPQPDDDVPRFGYEEHLAALTADAPTWPQSTRHISQLRVTLEWASQDWLRQLAGIRRRLHLDIVDYPGEWLADIGLLEQPFSDWSEHVMTLATDAPKGPARDAWLEWSKASAIQTDSNPEQVALKGAKLFTAYLGEQKEAGRLPPSAGPGRFLMPGDFEGSPLLTFFPHSTASKSDDPKSRGKRELENLLSRRFESYKTSIVRPFFERHFSRLDRQIVLVDVLGALNHGPAAVLEMENALEGALTAFRPGRDSWLGRLFQSRVDSILFAATKADHLHRRNHKTLSAILQKVVDRARQRATDAGARIGFAAIAALRATEDVERQERNGSAPLTCVRGIPLPGETLDGRLLDPSKAVTVFPGDLPPDPIDAFNPDILAPGSLSFVRFRPRPGQVSRQDQEVPDEMPWAHIGLDNVVRFLIGDRLT